MAGRAGRPLERPVAFWDTSALVPLCAHQGITPRVIALYRNYGMVVWWATPVEIASALRRLVRMKQLTPDDWVTSRRLALDLAESWRMVQPSNALRSNAAQLCRASRFEGCRRDAVGRGPGLVRGFSAR